MDLRGLLVSWFDRRSAEFAIMRVSFALFAVNFLSRFRSNVSAKKCNCSCVDRFLWRQMRTFLDCFFVRLYNGRFSCGVEQSGSSSGS